MFEKRIVAFIYCNKCKNCVTELDYNTGMCEPCYNESIIRQKAKGTYKYYEYNKEVIEVKHCSQAWLYTNPGYYISVRNRLPYSHPLLSKRFDSALQAVKAYIKVMKESAVVTA